MKNGDGEDDAVQAILMNMIEGKGKHQTIGQMVIDYLRKRSGRSDSTIYEMRMNIEFPTGLREHLLKSTENDMESDKFNEYAALFQDPIMRAVFGLKYLWGFDATEIGRLFGFEREQIWKISEQINKIITKTADEDINGN